MKNAIHARTLLRTAHVAAVVVGIVAATTAAAPADAPGYGRTVVEASGLIDPMSLEIDSGGTAFLTQDSAGVMTRINRDLAASTMVTAPGKEIGSASTRGNTMYYTLANREHRSAVLMRLTHGRQSIPLADLGAWEAARNPDAANHYGFTTLPAACRAQFSTAQARRAQYTGTVSSRPNATLALHNGIYVADAGANAILHVAYSGKISTVAVLPAQPPVVLTAASAAANGFPRCTAGLSYRAEAAPTDVEIGRGGVLYVSTSPGGLARTGVAAPGSVYRVDPDTGRSTAVATGFAGATSLGVSSATGVIVVAERFGGPRGTGQVSILRPGSPRPEFMMAVSAPASVELRTNTMYVTTSPDAPASGTLIKVDLAP